MSFKPKKEDIPMIIKDYLELINEQYKNIRDLVENQNKLVLNLVEKIDILSRLTQAYIEKFQQATHLGDNVE